MKPAFEVQGYLLQRPNLKQATFKKNAHYYTDVDFEARCSSPGEAGLNLSPHSSFTIINITSKT